MPVLYVVPHDIVEMMNNEGISLKVLSDLDQLAQALSAHDMAEIHLAQTEFPFRFDPSLAIELGQSPVKQLALNGKHEELHYRVTGRVNSLKLTQQATAEKFTPVYTLNIVDENTWVAVQQRQHTQSADPVRLLRSLNQAFFDSLIAQALQTQSFEEVCKTNLFTYFLESYTPKAA